MIYFKKVNFLAKFKIIFSPPPETGEKFMCKSVMYYYNEQVANMYRFFDCTYYFYYQIGMHSKCRIKTFKA